MDHLYTLNPTEQQIIQLFRQATEHAQKNQLTSSQKQKIRHFAKMHEEILKKNEELLVEQRRLIAEIDKSPCMQEHNPVLEKKSSVATSDKSSIATKAPVPIGKLDVLNKEAIKKMRPGERGTFAIARPDTKVGKPWATPRMEEGSGVAVEKQSNVERSPPQKPQPIAPKNTPPTPAPRAVPPSTSNTSTPKSPPQRAPTSPPQKITTPPPPSVQKIASAPANRPISQPGTVSAPPFASKKPASQIQHPVMPANPLSAQSQRQEARKDDVKYPLLMSNFTQGGLRSKM